MRITIVWTDKGAVIINSREGVEAFLRYEQKIVDPRMLALKNFKPHLIFAKNFQTFTAKILLEIVPIRSELDRQKKLMCSFLEKLMNN